MVNCRNGEVSHFKAGCHLHEVRDPMDVILLLTVFDAEPHPPGDGQSLGDVGDFLSSTCLLGSVSSDTRHHPHCGRKACHQAVSSTVPWSVSLQRRTQAAASPVDSCISSDRNLVRSNCYCVMRPKNQAQTSEL